MVLRPASTWTLQPVAFPPLYVLRLYIQMRYGAARLGLDASVVLFVVHVYREEIDGKEITRIISARRANKDDFRRYQEQEMD